MRRLLMLAAFCASTIAISQARADTSWVDGLTNRKKQQCCYDNDGRRLEAPDWRRRADGGFDVFFSDRGWWPVPYESEVLQNNQDGIARVWSFVTPDGERHLACFLPGSES